MPSRKKPLATPLPDGKNISCGEGKAWYELPKRSVRRVRAAFSKEEHLFVTVECDAAVPFFQLLEQEGDNNHDEDNVHFSL